jgi:hypothetical protein
LLAGAALAVLAVPVALWPSWTIGGSLLLVLLLLAALLGLVAAVERSLGWAEAASGVAVATLLSQFAQWRLSEGYWYSLPIGLWLLGLAELRLGGGYRRVGQALTWSGVLVLLLPAVARSLTDETWRYSLLTGALALFLLGLGLWRGRRAFVAGGTLALSVVATRQLFDGLRALPNWAILGLVGLTMLLVAIGLLLQRERLGRAGGQLGQRWRSWR